MTTVELDIDGMTCAGCAARVEKALAAVGGVENARVNLALERASVDGDTSAAALITAVEGAGYAAWSHEEMDPDVKAAMEKAADRKAWIVFALSTLLTLPFLVQMGTMMLGLPWMLPYWLEPILAGIVVFGAGHRFFLGAWKAVLNGAGTMDVLVSLGTGAAYFFSLWLVFDKGAAVEGHLYFEAAAVIITLVLFGKRLEARAKAGTTEAIRGLMALRPETADREKAPGQFETVAVEDVRLSDILRVRPGDRFPVDGKVVEGRSSVDEAMVTGESVPVLKQPGDAVIGGSTNGDGLLRVEATAVGRDTTLAKIVRLVERAQGGKAPVQKRVDRISAIFVPVVLGLAAVTFLAWFLFGDGVGEALVAAVSVLVIACPCALGLASPTAIVAGTGAAAKAGILVKDVEAMERAGDIDTVLFDKTGTLTEGRPKLVRQTGGPVALALAIALQRGSSHPLAEAFTEAGEGEAAALPSLSEHRNHPGEGVSATLDGATVALGNLALMARLSIDLTEETQHTADEWAAQGETVSFLARAGAVIGIFGILDAPRQESGSAIQALKSRGFRLGMISGDSEAAAGRIAFLLHLDHVEAGVKPDRKAGRVRALQREGHKVAMVGDGINDAPALVQADLGIAMGGGSDIALEAAPITLMRSDLALVPASLEICRKTVSKIRQNLFWAFIYNIVGLPLAAMGFLSPGIAGAAMALSSVSVVTSSLLLRGWKPAISRPGKGA